MSDLRHGSGAEDCPAGCTGRRLRTAQYDAPVLRVCRIDLAGPVGVDAPDDRRPGGPLVGKHSVPVAATSAQYAGSSMGRLAVLRAWFQVYRHMEPRGPDQHRGPSAPLPYLHERFHQTTAVELIVQPGWESRPMTDG